MTFQALLRFVLGTILAGILLAIILPFVGVPSSHYLPPSWVYNRAQGTAHGHITGKYYDNTGNPFNVGAQEYFLNYTFKAPAPGPAGQSGPKQDYTGTIRVIQDTYNKTGSASNTNSTTTPAAQQVIPEPPYPVHIKYDQTYPDINGVTDTWGMDFQNGRNIGAGSNDVSGWIIWVVVSIFLGYFMAMLLGRFMAREEI